MEINTKQTETKEKIQTKKKNKTRFMIVVAVAMITLIIGYIMFRGSYLEIMEIGENYSSVFWQNVSYRSVTLLVNFILIYFMFYIVNTKIKKGLKEFFDQEKKEMPKLVNKSIAFIIAIIVSSLISGVVLEKAMLCFHSAQFGKQDPIFNLDIGYFIFQKPFIELMIWYFMLATIGLLIYTVIYYITTFNMFFDGIDRKTLKNSKLFKQITSFLIIMAVLLAALIWIKTQNMGTDKFLTLQENETTYSLYGAGFTDVTIKLWGYRILPIVLIVSVYLAVKSFKEGKTKKIILSIAAVPAYLVGMFLVIIIFQAVFVTTNELDKEKQYIEANINYTKDAYGIDIQEITLNSTLESITSEELKQYEEVLNNITIASKDTVLKDLKNTQTAKGYYSYRNTQIGKYNINGKEQLVYVSPREIVSSNGTYNNKTYEYTHGYSAILTSATTTKENGTLNHLQKGFEKTDEAITITEPRIYFGMQTNDTAVTNSKGKTEFDFPMLDSNVAENAENTYTGNAGLTLNLLDRIILAIKEGDLKLALSSNVTKESKILTNRNIIKRAQTIMPYLMYDENPYLVVTEEGKLVWVLDAYTISNNYPYSQKTMIRETSTSKFELNYIRNSIKVLIDSYDGTVSFYITDRNDPIAMAYRNIYPNLFMDLEEEIPADISQHFVYPEYLYNIQANIVARYHNMQPEVLYRGDDIWKIATYNTSKVITKTGTNIAPYYTMLKSVDNENPQLGLIVPYTPEERQNIISYLVGTYDNSANGKLTLYKYQTDSNMLGPMQLDTQIGQDETIKKEIDSLNVNGTKVTKDMIIVPLNHTLLYVEPIYTQYINEEDALPTLKKVVVASGTKVAIGDNLKQALSNLVSQYAVNIEIENTDTMEALINTIIKANNNLSNSNTSNDWEMMGKDVKKLQELIQKLEKLVEEENKTKNEIEQKNGNNMVDLENDIVEANEI